MAKSLSTIRVMATSLKYLVQVVAAYDDGRDRLIH